ncbi:MAG: hypothetical protein Q8S73_20095 [Deltaproteobacteria bacterium]|nr:hypothetical protein [Myxococcales bacterium]MDP3216420.1 hypothetical protein [Deltaproteobacteria bacterium]
MNPKIRTEILALESEVLRLVYPGGWSEQEFKRIEQQALELVDGRTEELSWLYVHAPFEWLGVDPKVIDGLFGTS